jgi:hypothetical protein
MTLRRLDIKFGAVPRHSRLFTDRTARLPLGEIGEIRKLLRLYRRKFPQSLLSVFVTNDVQNGTISEYAFWLANRARFGTVQAVAGDNFDVLLAVDLASGAALVVGYGLENYLSERDLEDALTGGSGAFPADDVPRGIRECIERLTNRMRDVVKEIEGK